MPGRLKDMSKKSDSKSSNNVKVLRLSLAEAKRIHDAFLRDNLRMDDVHPGQLSCMGLLFPTFNPEVQS